MNQLKELMLFRLNDNSDLVKKADYNTKILEIEKKIPNHDKYVIANDFNKFSGVMFDEKLLTINLNTVEQCLSKLRKKYKNYK